MTIRAFFCRLKEGFFFERTIICKLNKLEELIMGRSDEVVGKIQESENTIVGALNELDKEVERLHDVIANIPSEDMSDDARLKVEAALDTMKINVLAAVTKAATDNPKEEPPIPGDV